MKEELVDVARRRKKRECVGVPEKNLPIGLCAVLSVAGQSRVRPACSASSPRLFVVVTWPRTPVSVMRLQFWGQLHKFGVAMHGSWF